MLGRAALRRKAPAHAYLMLLRVEVAAFHPAMPRPVAQPHATEMAVAVRALARPPRRLVSVALFLGLPAR